MSNFATIGFTGKPRRGAPVFTEKTFYLEEFYGKSLLFALIPPAGQRISEFDSLLQTLRELRRNQTRCVVIVSPSALPKLMRRLGRLAPKEPPPVFNPSEGTAFASLSARFRRRGNLGAAARRLDRRGLDVPGRRRRSHRLRARARQSPARFQAPDA
jgi:hypothetical protein